MSNRQQARTLLLGVALVAMLPGAAIACGGGELVLEDTFQSLDRAWNFTLGDNAKTGPQGLVIEYQPNSYFLALNQSNLFSDVEICGEFAIQFEPGANAYAGLAFWGADKDNVYTADVFPNFGTFAV